VNDGFPLDESRGRGFDDGAGFGVRTEPARPLLAGVFGVAGADKKLEAAGHRHALLHAMHSNARRSNCPGRGGGGTPPFEAAPLRKKLRVKRAGFVGAFCLVFGTEGKKLFRDWRCSRKTLPEELREMPVICADPGLGKLRGKTPRPSTARSAPLLPVPARRAARPRRDRERRRRLRGRTRVLPGRRLHRGDRCCWREVAGKGTNCCCKLRLAGSYRASRCKGGCALRSSDHDIGARKPPGGAAFHQSRKHRWAPSAATAREVTSRLGSFVENETLGCGFPRIARYAEDAAAGFCAGN